jgi:hypothetical protein
MNAIFEPVRTGVYRALTSADVTGLTQFVNGTTADADEVNANFTAVVDCVNTELAGRTAPGKRARVPARQLQTSTASLGGMRAGSHFFPQGDFCVPKCMGGILGIQSPP